MSVDFVSALIPEQDEPYYNDFNVSRAILWEDGCGGFELSVNCKVSRDPSNTDDRKWIELIFNNYVNDQTRELVFYGKDGNVLEKYKLVKVEE